MVHRKLFFHWWGSWWLFKWKHRTWSKGMVSHGTSGITVFRNPNVPKLRGKLIMSGTCKAPCWSHCPRSPVGGEIIIFLLCAKICWCSVLLFFPPTNTFYLDSFIIFYCCSSTVVSISPPPPHPSLPLTLRPTLWICPGAFKHIHSSTIYNSQVLEAPYVPISKWVDQKTMVHLYNGILHSRKKEGAYTLRNSMDGTGEHYAKWNKPVSERQIPYDLTYKWNLIQQNKQGIRI